MSWLDTVKKYAPLLAETALNPAAGAIDAVKMIAQEFGANPDNQDDIAAKIDADPQAEYKFKLLELKLTKENNSLDAFKTKTSDVEDARQKLIDRAKAGIKNTPEVAIIYSTIFALFLTLIGLFLLIWNSIKLEGVEWAMIGSVVTSIVNTFRTQTDYFFGSSKT